MAQQVIWEDSPNYRTLYHDDGIESRLAKQLLEREGVLFRAIFHQPDQVDFPLPTLFYYSEIFTGWSEIKHYLPVIRQGLLRVVESDELPRRPV